MRTLLRRLGWLRVTSAVVGLAGVAVVVWLIVAPASLALRDLQGETSDDPDTIVACYSSLTLPDALPRGITVVDTDAKLNGVDSGLQYGSSIRLHNYCERLRSARLSSALLVAVPSTVLLCASVSWRRRTDDV